MLEELWDLDAAAYYVSFEALAFLVEGLILLWVGKLIKDVITPYKINEELTTNDNKALAVSYAGYMVAQGVIILGVMQGPADDLVQDLIGVAVWSLIGIVLLNVAMVINDKILLRKFDNVKEIITDRNVGTGAVQAGTFLGTAFLIRAVIIGESHGDWVSDLTNVGIFFVVGQIGFIVFSMIYQGMAKYDIHDEIEKDNAAAGLGFGLTLFAIGVIMGQTISTTLSLAAFGVWFFTGVVLLVVTRILVDKLILPDHKLDTEIAEDRNWGAALIEEAAP